MKNFFGLAPFKVAPEADDKPPWERLRSIFEPDMSGTVQGGASNVGGHDERRARTKCGIDKRAGSKRLGPTSLANPPAARPRRVTSGMVFLPPRIDIPEDDAAMLTLPDVEPSAADLLRMNGELQALQKRYDMDLSAVNLAALDDHKVKCMQLEQQLEEMSEIPDLTTGLNQQAFYVLFLRVI